MSTLHSTTIDMNSHVDNICNTRAPKFQNILTLRTIISISAAHIKTSNVYPSKCDLSYVSSPSHLVLSPSSSPDLTQFLTHPDHGQSYCQELISALHTSAVPKSVLILLFLHIYFKWLSRNGENSHYCASWRHYKPWNLAALNNEY